MTLSIRTFGSLEVSLDGEPLELPASRKTRALLGFLILSGGPQRRDRLCRFLWDAPDASRAALRWSLSKLRPVVNAGGCIRLITDRERVKFSPDEVAVDFHELRDCVNNDNSSPEALARAWELSNQHLMVDCELPNQAHFTAWLRHQRNESTRLRIQLSQRLALCPDLPPEEAEKWARRWLQEAPLDPRAAQQAVRAERRLRPERNALGLASELSISFREAGLAVPNFSEPGARSPGTSGAVATDPTETAGSKQVVRFTRASDGAALAWASVGAAKNPPLVKAANWLSHLELDWEAPIWSSLLHELADTFRLIRYDKRGCGRSDREVPEIGFERFVSDLETVVDAAGLDRFPLLGVSQGASVSIEYAARHPERVSHLILLGGNAAGWRHTASREEIREHEAVMILTEAGWGRECSPYRTLLSKSLMPDANREELNWFDDFQRRTTSPKNAVKFMEAFSRIDVRDRLEDVQAPTLVLHSRGDTRVPVATARELATRIPNAEFVSLDSNNHLLLGRERASNEFLQNVHRFLMRDSSRRRVSHFEFGSMAATARLR